MQWGPWKVRTFIGNKTAKCSLPFTFCCLAETYISLNAKDNHFKNFLPLGSTHGNFHSKQPSSVSIQFCFVVQSISCEPELSCSLVTWRACDVHGFEVSAFDDCQGHSPRCGEVAQRVHDLSQVNTLLEDKHNRQQNALNPLTKMKKRWTRLSGTFISAILLHYILCLHQNAAGCMDADWSIWA